MAVRADRCRICRSVAYVEDVNARLFDSEGVPKRQWKAAADYLRSVGVSGSYSTLVSQLQGHQKHVAQYLAGAPAAPAAGGVTRLTVSDTPADWLDVNQQAMNIGLEALRGLAGRLQSGELEVKEEMELARLGLGAAHKRGDHLTRGKLLRDQAEDLLRLASGYDDDSP